MVCGWSINEKDKIMIPAGYTLRNIMKRKITSGLTIFGVMLVIFVFAGVLMLNNGLQKTLVATGSDNNVIIIRKSSQTEVMSIITRDQAQIVSTSPEIAKAPDGTALYTNEVYVLISLPNRKDGEKSNVVARGVTDKSFVLRPNLKLIAGRMWKDAGSEIVAGKATAAKFNCGIGDKVRFGAREWTVVGIMDAAGSAFDSEIWGDYNQLSDAFRRPMYSSLTFRMVDPSQFDSFKARIEADIRLPLEVFHEKEYYANQSKFMTTFVGIVGTIISIIFSLGAIVGAMITMYAAVANRTREIGTLRALGFGRGSILSAFLFESIIISLLGGALGMVAASFLRLVQVSTTNFDTFSELAFNFHLLVAIVIQAIIFAVVMGVIGGFLPAVRASRLKIVDSLRAT